MSELMTPIPFRELMTWITTEYRRDGAVFGVHKPYKAGVKKLPIFGETIETPFGPAAGPNTQLAQNIIAGYFAGARFFELKTVQKMDGADLAACINRPCILAEDECYNCEWSTELYVQQAFEEYVKAWCALKIMAKVYGLGDPNGFVFNMSVGYDLAGIQGEKIDTFLNGMVDASKTPIFQECIAVLKEFFPGESDYIDTITPHVSGSVTVSTLHGCPPDEIERIASYLLEKKHLHTFVKCNPTILGYETARSILDSMGYDYIAFDDHHFKEDLQYSDAVPMFHRLQALADREGLEFGLKLSNTFPVDVKAGELPSEEMYMAGKSLFPLTTTMAAMMAKEFGGKLRLSYAGGADAQYFANAVIGEAHKFAIPAKAVATREEAVAKKGVLCESAKCEGDRCLTCNVVCQVCADVCPNRANVVIELPDGRQQILHVDRMCNECGNCAVFCPYDSAPYREKFTLFLTREGFDESVNNQGFLPLGGKKVLVRLDSKVFEADLDAKNDLPADIEVFIWTVLTKYAYLMG